MADNEPETTGVSVAKFFGGGGGKFITAIVSVAVWAFLVYSDKLETLQEIGLGGLVCGVLVGALSIKDIIGLIAAKKEVPNP